MLADKTKKTLLDAEITTVRSSGRRGFLGLMAATGVSATLMGQSARAQGTDADTGELVDEPGCGRGGGGISTGVTDIDTGNITDSAGWGRGAPYC